MAKIINITIIFILPNKYDEYSKIIFVCRLFCRLYCRLLYNYIIIIFWVNFLNKEKSINKTL